MAEKEHTTFEGYEHLDSSLKFYTSDFFHRTINENDDEPEEILDQLRADYAELEAENARLKKELKKPEVESGSEAEPEVKVESEDYKTQASNLWEVMADLHTEHQIELLIEKFGEEHVKQVFKEDYKLYKDAGGAA